MAVQFEAENREQLYGWVNRTLREQDYEHLVRQSKGLVRLYMAKMTGMSYLQSRPRHIRMG